MQTIQSQYENLKSTTSDINEHLAVLHDLAKECNHVTEFGVRTGVSTTAILAGLKKDAKFVAYDLTLYDQVSNLIAQSITENKNFEFNIGDTREIEIEETDMLFIDTLHNASTLEKELARSGNKARKYLAFHDVVTFGQKGETEEQGLMFAIDAFLKENKHRKIKKLYENNNGLLVLERK